MPHGEDTPTYAPQYAAPTWEVCASAERGGPGGNGQITYVDRAKVRELAVAAAVLFLGSCLALILVIKVLVPYLPQFVHQVVS